jgi:chondroitin AC lyase
MISFLDVAKCQFKRYCLSALLIFFLHSISFSQDNDDIAKIKAKLYSISVDAKYPEEYYTDKSIDALIKHISSAGNWPDINYLDKTDSKWAPAEHWVRLLKLAVNYKHEKGPYYGNKELRIVILNAIAWWLKERPQANNYWWNAIGIPGYMGEVFILMEKDLDDNLKIKGAELMKVGVKPTYYDYHGVATGQNLFWIANAHLYASCISNDIEGCKRAFKSVSDEIVITEKEGIQPDYSFYQHGQQNYAFGYGKGFSTMGVRFFYLANQTAFQFSKEKIDIISHYILYGQQWMSHYNYLEYTAMGREISRNAPGPGAMLIALKWMEEIDTAKALQYQSFYKRLSNIRSEISLIGNRYFWRSDLMVHQRKDYYFSLKTTSDRILSSESGNGENLKGFYQGNGTYYLIRKGDEYKDIFPIWDWRKIPGSLIAQKTGSLPLFNWGSGSRGSTSFVYGISDSLYGCFAYDYKKDNVTARRSWFLFDHEIICLANSINGDSLYQGINQSLLKGEVWTDIPKSKNKNPQKVFHDSIGYWIDNNHYSVEVKNEKQKGSWKEINLTSSADEITKSVFSLGIKLGDKVVDASLVYAIVPSLSLEEFKQYSFRDHVTILQNNKFLQAVYQKDIAQVQAVFFDKGKLELPWNKLKIQMNKQGLVILKKINNKLLIDYSQPYPKKHIEIVLGDNTQYQNDEIEINR